jgi:ferritin-like metal-binding protein YciE
LKEKVMTDTIKQGKLIQYLSEAYGKEKELETALQAHIGMTTRKPYKKRLQDHLKETKSHARELERRIKQLGGDGPQLVDKVPGQAVAKAVSLAKGPLHMVRGTGEAEKMLKNAKTEYFNEHEEIATYTAIETLAEAVNDKETAKLARAIRRDEERMAKFLEAQIPVLTKAVVTEEIPASERSNGAGSSRRSSRKRSTASRRSSNGARASSSRKRSSSSSSSSSARKASTSRKRSSSSRSRSGSRTRAKSGSRS